MNAAQLIDHFDRISDAPDAIRCLRRFILDLAVRGKVVEQEPNDEPASELLKRIQAEKTRLIKERKIRKQEPTLPVEMGDQPFELPTSWEWVRFGGIADFSAGRTPSRHDFSYWNTGDYPWVSIADMTDGGVVVTTKETVSEKAKDHVFRSEPVPVGTLIMSFKLTIGKISRLGVPAFHNEAIISIHPHLAAMDAYLFKVLPRFSQQGDTKDAIKGATLNRESITNIFLPLPPLAEQHRIIAKVDELMTLCDRLETAKAERENRRDKLAAASLHRLNDGVDADEVREHARFHLRHLPRLTTRSEHTQQLRQTILNLAVRGKLVPQDFNDEPSSELVKRIQVEKEQMVKKGTIKRLNPAPQIDAAEVPAEVPDSWIWARLSDLMCGESQNGYSKKPDDALDGIPILRISAGTVRRDGIVAEEEHKLISGVTAAQQEQYLLQPGDLLACRFNGNRGFVGRLSLYLGYLGIKPIYPDKLIRLRMHSQLVLPKLIRCFSESNIVRSDIESYCATTVGNWGISAANLKLVKFPLPPLAEQHRIVAKVDELMALCDRLEAQLTTTQTESRRLLEAVVHEALNGSIHIN